MKKVLKSISNACIILVLLVSLGCGSQAESWVTGMMWNSASSLVSYAVEALAISLFPDLGTTIITTTPTEKTM